MSARAFVQPLPECSCYLPTKVARVKHKKITFATMKTRRRY